MHCTWLTVFNLSLALIIFEMKYGPNKICGRQLLINLKGYYQLKTPYPFKFYTDWLPFTNFNWSVLEYFVLFANMVRI